MLPQLGSQLRSLHLSKIGVSKSNELTGRPRRRKTLMFPKTIDQKEIAGTLGNCKDLFSRERKRDDYATCPQRLQVHFWPPEYDCVDTDRCREDRCCSRETNPDIEND